MMIERHSIGKWRTPVSPPVRENGRMAEYAFSQRKNVNHRLKEKDTRWSGQWSVRSDTELRDFYVK
jgi:hypothetical protein